jgi:hypothetical protein
MLVRPNQGEVCFVELTSIIGMNWQCIEGYPAVFCTILKFGGPIFVAVEAQERKAATESVE